MNPFRISGPALISFSGGRTSALMLRRILDAHDNHLPDDVHVVFANTGKERLETLDFVRDCGARWNVPIVWLERLPGPHGKLPHDARFRVVDYATASRKGEPFETLIREREYTPNVVTRFCTQELKIRVMRDFMRALGYEHWMNVVGLRADEAHRVANVHSRAGQERWDTECPLHAARITVEDVGAFWQSERGGLSLDRWLALPPAQRPGWDLALRSYEGNCDLCFLKGRGKRMRIMREHPEFVAWWADQETFVKGRFHAHEPGYAKTLDTVRRLPLLPMDLDGEGDTIPCTCTD